jgi:2-deoxy-D-gluconate 3-dehydrogenase
MNAFDLTGKLAVVTGARRGIGRAMARALAEAGADVIGVSANLEESGSEVEKDVTAAGRTFEAIRTDFADRAAVHALGENLAGRDRPVDILVNNAGTIRRAPAAEHSDADWDLVLQVNLTSQFVLVRAVGNVMAARRQGKIIFTASLLSYQGGITVPGSGPSTALSSASVASAEAAATVYDAFETVAAPAADSVAVEESYISAVPVVNTGRP